MEQIESNQNDGVKNLSEEEIEKIKEAFEAYDNRGRGKFSPKDFKASMESSGRVSMSHRQQLFRRGRCQAC